MHQTFRALGRVIGLLVLCLLLTPAMATAQMGLPGASDDTDTAAPALPDPLTPEAANALISRLSDSEVRALLLDQLNTQAVAEADGVEATGSDFFYHATEGALNAVLVAVERLPLLFNGQARAFSNFYEAIGGGTGLLLLLGYAVLVFGIAVAAELAFRRATRNWRILPPADPENMTLRETLQLLGQRLTTQVLAVVVFLLVARLVGRAILPAEFVTIVQLIGIYIIGFPRFMLALVFFFFAPVNPEYRLLNVTTPEAKALRFHQFWLAMLLGLSVAWPTFNAHYGVPVGETRLGFWLNLGMHIYLGWLFVAYRHGCVTMMRGFEPQVTPGEDFVARAYPWVMVAMIASMWWIVNIVASYGNFDLLVTGPHYKTMILLVFAPAMDTAVRGIVRHAMPPMSGEGAVAERAHYATKRSFVRIGRVVIFAGVILLIADFWGMSAQSIASRGVGERLASSAMEFLFILSIGYLIYEAASLFINRKLAAEISASGYDPNNAEFGGDGGGAGGSRLSTVLPLILLITRIAIVVIFLLLALGNIGVDTTPLLAGAGIVGLAIGFGAQKLVSDVVSGIFFLIDDAFRTGEYVEVEGTMGTVEKISIRSMQLRHHKGPIHTLPYGEIPKITNFSRDWVIMKLRFTVPFDTDPNKVKKIFKKIGQELMEVPEFEEDFLAPFKSQGVLEIDDVGMVIRGKFMCKPGAQFMIRKEIYNRVSAAFAEAGIDFARREVRVALPHMDGKQELTEEDKESIAAAASQAAQEQVAEAQKDDR